MWTSAVGRTVRHQANQRKLIECQGNKAVSVPSVLCHVTIFFNPEATVLCYIVYIHFSLSKSIIQSHILGTQAAVRKVKHTPHMLLPHTPVGRPLRHIPRPKGEFPIHVMRNLEMLCKSILRKLGFGAPTRPHGTFEGTMYFPHMLRGTFRQCWRALSPTRAMRIRAWSSVMKLS
jgi:hypothetical protein